MLQNVDSHIRVIGNISNIVSDSPSFPEMHPGWGGFKLSNVSQPAKSAGLLCKLASKFLPM